MAEDIPHEHFERKLDPRLRDMIANQTGTVAPAGVPVIVQTIDGLQDADREMLRKIGGSVKDDLHIIESYSADVPLNSLLSLARVPRILQISYDAQVRLLES